MNSSTIYKYAPFFVYALCCMQFYNYVGFNATYVKLASFAIQPLMVLLCYNQLLRRSSHPLYQYMQWILISLLLSFVSAWVFWGQGAILTYRASATMFTILFFFYLCKRNPPIEFIEKFIWIFCIAYCVMWLYALSQVPNLVFGVGEDELVNEDMSRGIIRLSFPGKAFIVLGFFLSVNKLYTTKKKYFIAIAVLLFIVIVMQVVRQIIGWSALVVAGYIYFKNKKLSIAVGVVAILFFALGNNIKFSDNSILGSLTLLTERQVEENETNEDIRITEYKYFFGKYSKNIVTSIIGNGKPHSESSYGKANMNLMLYDRLFLSDVGYAMMYAVTGALGLVLYLLLFFKSALIKVPDELSYARMFMIYFIPANIAASWYAKPDWQLCMAISVYILMMYGQNKPKGVKTNMITVR